MFEVSDPGDCDKISRCDHVAPEQEWFGDLCLAFLFAPVLLCARLT